MVFLSESSASDWQVGTVAAGSVSRREEFLRHVASRDVRGHAAAGEQCGRLTVSCDVFMVTQHAAVQ